MIFNAGVLNKKINIAGRITKTVNGFEKTVDDYKYKNISAYIHTQRGKEYFEAKQATNAEYTVITIRYRDNISQSDRVEYKNHIYEIQSIVNPDMANESLELYCVEKIRGKQEDKKNTVDNKPDTSKSDKKSGGWIP